jgi:fructose-1,6-bisphosphatase/inositol monophosphatase family enzyme
VNAISGVGDDGVSVRAGVIVAVAAGDAVVARVGGGIWVDGEPTQLASHRNAAATKADEDAIRSSLIIGAFRS